MNPLENYREKIYKIYLIQLTQKEQLIFKNINKYKVRLLEKRECFRSNQLKNSTKIVNINNPPLNDDNRRGVE